MKFQKIAVCSRGVHWEKHAAVPWVENKEALQGEPSAAAADGIGLEKPFPSLSRALMLARFSKCQKFFFLPVSNYNF